MLDYLNRDLPCFFINFWRTVGKEIQTVGQSFTAVTLLLDCVCENTETNHSMTITEKNECLKPSEQC